MSPTIQKRVAVSTLAARRGCEDLDADAVWKVLSATHGDTQQEPACAAAATSGYYSEGVDSVFDSTATKFSSSYGTNSEVDDAFFGRGSAPVVRHTPEEMSNLHLGHLYLVFDFVDTDLSKIIRSNQYMTKGHVQFILYQLLLGLKYMHSANVIHR